MPASSHDSLPLPFIVGASVVGVSMLALPLIESRFLFVGLCLIVVVGFVVSLHPSVSDTSWAKALLAGSVGATIMLGFFRCVGTVNQILYQMPGKYWNWLAVATGPFGYMAYRFKLWNQQLYGWVEVFVGVATAWMVTTREGGFQPAQMLAIVGGVYVVARGCANIKDSSRPRT